MGPFNTPWLTFFAWVVITASVLTSIVWAIFFFKSGGDER